MTKVEMSELFGVMLLAWPNAELFKGGIEKLTPTIELWASCLADIDFWVAQLAVKRLCRECIFPPTIAEMKSRSDQVAREVSDKIDLRWRMLLEDVAEGKTPIECFSKLDINDPVRLAIAAAGGPECVLSLSDDPVVNIKQYDKFKAAFLLVMRNGTALPAGNRRSVPIGRNRRLSE